MDKSKRAPEPIPQEFFRAVNKYLRFPQGSLRDYAFRREEWDSLEELARSQKKEVAQRLQQHVQKDIKLFQIEVTKAFRAKDAKFLQKLIRALKVPTPVEIRFSPVVAVLRAFDDLYEKFGQSLPSKQEVKELAAQYLKERGWPPISERQWPRVFSAAGLSSLSSVKFGPALKRRRA